jgi:alkanesulfonate monooxygenase SsuD/methylene tetrahydromethanopterin reductase-like flavin-dependent oxidoreductase (luciferase family)
VKFSLFSVVDHYPGRPRSVADYYAQLFRTTAEGEKLGYDVMLVDEHHFHEYGVVPNPAGIEL